jgi:hypothetical protein
MSKQLKPLEWRKTTNLVECAITPFDNYFIKFISEKNIFELMLLFYSEVYPTNHETIFTSDNMEQVKEFAFNHYKQQVEDLYE